MKAFFPLVIFTVLCGCQKQSGYDDAIKKLNAGNIKVARIAMIEVAESGDIQGMAWLMQDATTQGLEKASARKQFITWAEKCAEKGNATCAESAGIFYWSGIDGAIDFETAAKWLTVAKANGSASAAGWLEDVKKRKPAAPAIQKLTA